MATKPLPPGTCNFPVNMPVGFRRRIGRAAFVADLSLGELCRTALRKLLRFPQAVRLARAARVADEQAAAQLERALADGVLDASDEQAVRQAIAAVRRSARIDRIMGRFLSIRRPQPASA